MEKGKALSKVVSTKKLCYVALLTAICGLFHIYTIITGVKYFSISFTYVPCFVAGAFLGPLSGFAVGILGDLIGSLINPMGAYNVLIGISSGLLGFIPGVVFRYLKINEYIKIILSFLLSLLICTVFLNTFALFVLLAPAKTFWAFLSVRLPFQAIVATINFAIMLFLYNPMKKLLFKKNMNVPLVNLGRKGEKV